ncbi:hypothetical protein DAPPUDRAFT_272119 [Daphnia pulex]|uniref:Uncharacterized protein n=1 Tax=Daphnia pulex TaxID=6669 RepID=E9I2S1_DAPPU|nr:hypothetical protein DAPPUDRAFT_272119 [Daphnia pulex]|eukprot:EFX61709.1 hypothetical protein DAPPUDRAFT_272119 [Daphnia pulex]
MEELAASKEVKIVLRSDTSTGVQILQATSGIYKVLGDQVRNEPDRIFDDPLKLATKLQSGRFDYPFVRETGVYRDSGWGGTVGRKQRTSLTTHPSALAYP